MPAYGRRNRWGRSRERRRRLLGLGVPPLEKFEEEEDQRESEGRVVFYSMPHPRCCANYGAQHCAAASSRTAPHPALDLGCSPSCNLLGHFDLDLAQL